MRKLPTDENGARLTPPVVQPKLDQRRLGTRTIPLITQARSYELITPLFGGGAEPGMADAVTVIRGSEIRGHLRFWWRACRGGNFDGNLQEMKRAEDLLWGAASTEKRPKPSQVQIKVEITNWGQDEQPFETRTRASQGWGSLAYAAFPLQGDDERPPRRVRTGVAFTLTLTFPQSHQAEVEAALWAWETFGGIGARTRRGFGALRLVGVDGKPAPLPNPDNVEAGIRSGLERHVVEGTWPDHVPHLCRNLRMKVTGARSGVSSVRDAWADLIGHLKGFRQSRNPGARHPGRSRWPEPDEIRRLTGRRCEKHAEALSLVRKFPRAQLGLPIVFDFKDAGDPGETTLRGRDYDRLASPLILRPLACANGQAVGLALILEGTGLPPGGLVLKGVPGDPTVEATLTPDEAQVILPLRGNPDVLQVFLDTL